MITSGRLRFGEPALPARDAARPAPDDFFLGPMTRRTLLPLLAGALLLGAPRARAQEGAREAPAYDAPKPFEAFSRSALSLRDSLVALARAQIGTRYVRGGESPRRGFDCSGLVQYIVAALHLAVPRTAAQQGTVGEAVPRDTAHLLPGDLLTFGRGRRISHIGIYVGNGRMVHASTKAGKVIETDLIRPPARGIKPWLGVRRILSTDSVLASADSAR
jgi:hypothetical protein